MARTVRTPRSILANPATGLLLEALGYKADPFKNLEDVVRFCEEMNPRFPKDQRKLVRADLEKDSTNWPRNISMAIDNMSRQLGMRHGETPLPDEAYSLIVAFGGNRFAPLHRLLYVVNLLLERRVETGIVISVGSTRILREGDRPVAPDYAPSAETEIDLCNGAVNYVKKRYPDLNIVTVCKEDPEADTLGVIEAVMAYYDANVRKSADPISVGGVTTRIYSPNLEVDMGVAAKIYGWDGFAVAGHASDPLMMFNRTDATYLSELLTLIRKVAMALLRTP